MATQAEIQGNINEIVTGANYPANSMRPLLSSMLDFSSSGQTLVFDGLVAENTTSATTLILNYGVNIIRTSTNTNFACKLPQPVTGKRVIVVNASVYPISLFPSNVGGQINNYPIDSPAVIPPDVKAYDFICIENPLPGAWVWSPPATNQYDSGDIIGDSFGFTGSISALNAANVRSSINSGSLNSWADNGLNTLSIPFSVSSGPIGNNVSSWVAFKPDAGWSAITKIKIYTNLAWYPFANFPQFLINGGNRYNSYAPSTNTFIGYTPDPGPWQGAGSYFTVGNGSGVDINSRVPGGIDLPYLDLTANVGDPATVYKEYDIVTYGVLGSRVGNFFDAVDSNGNDSYLTTAISLFVIPRATLTGFKFRFFLEYY